ncbi:SLATT domain-containing protein [Neisseria chenwenguii]|uniref:SMODS and SLOG-associating 2TM effector domain-containing protein n=1 Tax=Neisseria chenwenguii TaxID=1853278 RepID=A0A220S274_9NEIS|nr:SLATT domain-containing protein [Neisseria chenwenguii]ASK27584.1 hypothetical protein BG910_07385 [Neisseria chenwenguii]ROV55529.1 SLATT domain-containing protein [Neisseria chenwenguii]
MVGLNPPYGKPVFTCLKYLEIVREINWIIREVIKSIKHSAFEQLLYSARTTANCKYGAATRLTKFKLLTFCVTTMLSLGLIFIPLWATHYPHPHKFSNEFLNIFQIFLAVATLVYSVIISMAGYDLRIYKLQDCGGQLRAFVKKLRLKKENKVKDGGNGNDIVEFSEDELKQYQKEYHRIVSSSEQHTDLDYLIYQFEDKKLCKRIFSLYYFKKFWNLHTISFLIPLFMMLLELLVITDLIRVTNILPDL